MSLKEKLTTVLNVYGGTLFERAGDSKVGEQPYTGFVNTKYAIKHGDQMDTVGFEDVVVKVVDQECGEGEGDVCFYILNFTEGDESALVRLNASYSSYNGSEYLDWDFVTAVEVVVTQYQKI